MTTVDITGNNNIINLIFNSDSASIIEKDSSYVDPDEVDG